MSQAEWVPKGEPFPARFAFFLENPLRKLLTRKKKLFIWAGLKKGMEVLELGPGPGFFTISLANWVRPGIVHAVDIQQDMIFKLQRKLSQKRIRNVKTYVAPAWQLPLNNETVDAVFAYQVLEEVKDLRTTAIEICRVMRPGGLLAIFQLKFDFGKEQKEAMMALLPEVGFRLEDEMDSLFTWKAKYIRV